MDPNETLNHIRSHIDEALKAKTRNLNTATSYLAFAAARFTELDNWLSKGGNPPEDWQPKGVYTVDQTL